MSDIYRYMDLGIVHFKAFPEIVDGGGAIIDSLKKLIEDDFWTAVEIGWIKDDKKRSEVRKLLEVSAMKVCYACQPRVLSQKLNLNSFDKAERRKAIEGVKKGIDEAYHIGATSIRVLSGKDPGDEKREEAKKIFVDSLSELCEYNRDFGDAMLYMKIFDRDIDKKALIGHFSDAADVAEAVYSKYKNFGVLADLSHFPLLREKPEEAIPLVEKFPMHFHLGNCIMRDRKHPLYGDLQPRFGIPGGETDVKEVADFFRLLLKRKLVSPEKRPVVSVEVRPLLMEEYSEAIIAQAKRVIKLAWAAAQE
ncbi:MAG: TIM barrel protein [Spirochaetales bacterium]|nr:TIM barrel protein [Spirochaetales bacterium]